MSSRRPVLGLQNANDFPLLLDTVNRISKLDEAAVQAIRPGFGFQSKLAREISEEFSEFETMKIRIRSLQLGAEGERNWKRFCEKLKAFGVPEDSIERVTGLFRRGEAEVTNATHSDNDDRIVPGAEPTKFTYGCKLGVREQWTPEEPSKPIKAKVAPTDTATARNRQAKNDQKLPDNSIERSTPAPTSRQNGSSNGLRPAERRTDDDKQCEIMLQSDADYLSEAVEGGPEVISIDLMRLGAPPGFFLHIIPSPCIRWRLIRPALTPIPSDSEAAVLDLLSAIRDVEAHFEVKLETRKRDIRCWKYTISYNPNEQVDPDAAEALKGFFHAKEAAMLPSSINITRHDKKNGMRIYKVKLPAMKQLPDPEEPELLEAEEREPRNPDEPEQPHAEQLEPLQFGELEQRQAEQLEPLQFGELEQPQADHLEPLPIDELQQNGGENDLQFHDAPAETNPRDTDSVDWRSFAEDREVEEFAASSEDNNEPQEEAGASGANEPDWSSLWFADHIDQDGWCDPSAISEAVKEVDRRD